MRLVGRDRELDALAGATRRAAAGEHVVVIVTGEPGIGKTRLLEHLPGAVWGRTSELGITPAFWPWLQILTSLETLDDRAPVLGSLDDRADLSVRLARFADVVAFIGRRGGGRPLVFDDAHAADPSSLQLLEYAVPLLRGCVVAIAARDSDAAPDVAAVLARIQRGAERLPLGRLGRDDVAAIVGDRADGGRVFELSEGNPLFVEELVASVATDGELRLPQLSSVRAVIAERVARLSKETAAVVVAAAVVGREFRGRVVADMLGIADIGPRVQPVLRLGMAQMTSPDRYRFSHALIAEAIAAELDPSERARLHLRAAQAIERHDSDALALAHHLLAAGSLAASAAVDAAELAARSAFAQLAFEDAAALLARAEQALQLAAPDDRARRATLICARAEALQHAAQHTRAAAACDDAAAIARELGDVALLARIALARGLEFRFGQTDPVLVSALQEAIALTTDIVTRARLLARLAAAEQPARDPQQPVARAFEAIELAKQLAPRDRLDVMYVATAAMVDYVAHDVLDGIHREVLELARGVDRWIVVHTRLRMCFTALERIDRAEFDQAVATFAAEARALGLPRWTRQTLMLDALAALLDGRFDDDVRLTDEAQAISAAIGDSGNALLTDVHRAMAAWCRGTSIDAGLAARLINHPRVRATLRAWFATLARDREAARAALAQVIDPLYDDRELFAMYANAVAFAGDRDEVERTYERCLARRGQIALASMVGSAVCDLYDRLLLVLAAACGKRDVIDEHATAALAVAAGLGSAAWTARVRADWERARGTPAPTHKLAAELTIAREGELWLVSAFGERVHIKDSRGMQMLARLVGEPHRELHVLELAGAGEAVDGGDAGPVLDAKARAAYRDRLRDLVAEREQAESWGDRGRAEKAAAEIEALTGELERAVGLGGQERKVGAASERARSNVQRRITHALEQVRAASARIGEHLVASIKTGTYCVYAP